MADETTPLTTAASSDVETTHLRREAAAEGERMLTEAQEMSERLLSEARQRSSSMVSGAESNADAIVANAQEEADSLRARIDEVVAEKMRHHEAQAAILHAKKEAELASFRVDIERARVEAQTLLSQAAATVRGLRGSTQRMLDATNGVHASLSHFETQLGHSSPEAQDDPQLPAGQSNAFEEKSRFVPSQSTGPSEAAMTAITGNQASRSSDRSTPRTLGRLFGNSPKR